MNLLVLLAGVAAAALGGELFVRGAVGLALWARVPARLVGATIAAFATSSPELSVGIQSALDGRPELALGDALGSNVFNIALVLGVMLVLGPMHAVRSELRREIGFALAAPVLTLIALVDGRLDRAEGVVLLAVFVVWLVAVAREALRERAMTKGAVDALHAERGGWPAVLAAGAGLVALVIAGRLIVIAAKGIGTDLGLEPFVVGATLVAFGTSVPELATVITSRRRGHSDVGVGTVLGSNVFNNLWIVGVVALIQPVKASVSEVVLAVVVCIVALLLVVPSRSDVLARWRGAVLLTIAVGYAVATVALGG